MNQENHKIEDIIRIFNQCFANEYNTRLERGGNYPIYLPEFMDEDGVPSERPYNVILFAHGYYSSALHEIAHWLVAGEARRKLEDLAIGTSRTDALPNANVNLKVRKSNRKRLNGC